MKEQSSEPSAGMREGVTMADVLALPDELCIIVTELMRRQEAGLAEIAAYVKQDEATTRTLFADLIAKGFVQEVRNHGIEQSRYRVRLAAKRGRALPLDL